MAASNEANRAPEEALIIAVEFVRIPSDFSFIPDGVMLVNYKASDGSGGPLFRYYTAELHFTERELVGLTVAQAHRLRHDRDVAYLQS